MYLLLKALALHQQILFSLDQEAVNYPSQNRHQQDSMGEFGPLKENHGYFE